MKAKALTTVLIIAGSVLLLLVFGAWNQDEESIVVSEETFVDRAVRTRINTEASRVEDDNVEETILERAVRTRADELVNRVEVETAPSAPSRHTR